MKIAAIIAAIALALASSGLAERVFQGSGTITVYSPTPTRLAICTPNEKYSMQPGGEYTLRLYVRNDLDDKTVRSVHAVPATDERLILEFDKDEIEEIPPTEYRFFDIKVTVPADMPLGDYRVDFMVGTDEYDAGAFHDEILIKVRKRSDSLHLLLYAISASVLLALAVRFLWFRKQNMDFWKSRTSRRKKKTRKSHS